MAKTYYLNLTRLPSKVVQFRQLPSLLSSVRLEVVQQQYSILGVLRVTFLEGALPVVVERVRINESFAPTLFLPYAAPEKRMEQEPLHAALPIILEEPGDSLGAITRIEGMPESLKESCYLLPIETVSLSTNCGELRFERVL